MKTANFITWENEKIMKRTVVLASLILPFIQIAAQAQTPAKPSKSTAPEMELACA